MTDFITLDDRLRKLIADHLGVVGFPWDARLAQDLRADSLDRVELAMAIEEEFGFEVDDDKAFAWRTAGDILASVKAQR